MLREQLQSQASALIDSVRDHSVDLRHAVLRPEKVQEKASDISNQLLGMQRALNQSYTYLPDDRKVFIPDYEVLKRFVDSLGFDINVVVPQIELNESGMICKLGKISNNYLSFPSESFRALSGLHSLEEIDLDESVIEDLTPLVQLQSLKKLTLLECKFSDFQQLGLLVQLASINLGIGITDISPLSKLVNLEFAELSHNEITDINPLRELPKLRGVDLYNNQLDPATITQDFKFIEILDLTNCGISDIDFISHFPNLRKLTLSENPICDVSALKRLRKLDYVMVEKSGLATKSHAILAGLKAKGVKVMLAS